MVRQRWNLLSFALCVVDVVDVSRVNCFVSGPETAEDMMTLDGMSGNREKPPSGHLGHLSTPSAQDREGTSDAKLHSISVRTIK